MDQLPSDSELDNYCDSSSCYSIPGQVPRKKPSKKSSLKRRLCDASYHTAKKQACSLGFSPDTQKKRAQEARRRTAAQLEAGTHPRAAEVQAEDGA